MSILSQAVAATPAFLSKPFINTDSLNAGAITVSSGDAFKHRAFDMSGSTQATSLGQNTDGMAWTYQAAFYEGSTKVAKNVTVVALLNINLKRFKVEYRVNGGSWTIVPGMDFTSVDFAAAQLIVAFDSLTPIVADEMLLTATDTQAANQEKAVGLFLPCALNFQASRGTSDLDNMPQDNIVVLELFDGSTDETVILHNDIDFDFFQTPLLFLGIPDTEEPLYAGLRGDFFLFVPQINKYPLNWFLCTVVAKSYKATPMSMAVDSRLKRIALSVKEVGGA